MELKEAKAKFIQAWGTLGSCWGINRAMAQIHALLLITEYALSAEEVMEALQISRGNANMNLRALMDWGLVYKELKPGDRKEYFIAEKDMWKVAMQVAKERRKRELAPMLNVLDELANLEDSTDPVASKRFSKTIADIKHTADKADNTLELLIKADENWFMNSFLKILRK